VIGSRPWAALAARLAWGTATVSLALVASAGIAELLGARSGLSAERRDWLLALLCAPLGARVVAYAPRNPCGWLLSVVGLLAAATVATSIGRAEALAWSRAWIWWPSFGLLILIVLLFPDGRAVSRFWRWLARITAAATAVGTVALAHLAARAPAGFLAEPVPVSPGWDTVAILAVWAVLAGAALLAPAALLVRLRRASTGDRGPLGWAVITAVLLLAGLLLDTVADVPLAWLGAALAVPVTVIVGVVRYGLYDIDRLLHRSLSYGLFAGGLIAAYTGAVAVATELVPEAAAIVAAGTVVLLLPLRQSIDGLVRRGIYGLSADPYRFTAALNRRIGLARTPEQVLRAAVQVISDGLKAPFVAIHLEDRTEPVEEASCGRRRDWPVSAHALTYRGTEIGSLVVQQRGPDEVWSRREQALLRHLADQLAPSAASVRLTHDLRAARERLVRAREDELRRIQRDLHDGVGPTLSGARMLAHVSLAESDDTAVRDNLRRIGDYLADAAAEVRRVVDRLRPPALEKGLAGALCTAVCRHETGGLAIDLAVVGDLTEVPAAVEVAVYRLVDEGLTNVVRHASANSVAVRVHRGADELRVVLDDDGVGGAASRPGGVGTSSMRERCEELGGSFEMLPLSPGTRLSAVIPLA
jgi:signal transduction histidine kinase